MQPCVKTACLAIICGLAVLQNPSYAAPASDNAGNVAYADGWQAGDNGGVGFMPWVLGSQRSGRFYSPDHSLLTLSRRWKAIRLVRPHLA